MTHDVQNISKRIIICAAADIEHYYNSQNIGAIFSVCEPEDLRWSQIYFDFSKTIHYVSTFHNPPDSIEIDQLRQYRTQAIRKDLIVAEGILNDGSEKQIIFHCRAGIHKSPMFVLLLLCHLQGNTPDIDLSLRLLYQIRPKATIDMVYFDREYLGKNFEQYHKAIRDFIVAKALIDPKNGRTLADRISNVFKQSVTPEKAEISKLCDRFGMRIIP